LGVRTPDVLAGICGGPVYVPDDINRYPGIRNGEWTLDPEREFEIFGRRLETFLRGEAIPLWLSMLEREAMAAEPGCGFCGEPGPLRQAVLYVDDADPALVQKWLDEAEHLDMPEAGEMVPWLRARLNNRIQTASG
jgi:hypothetical protein